VKARLQVSDTQIAFQAVYMNSSANYCTKQATSEATGGCWTGTGQDGMQKYHWPQRPTLARSSQEERTT